jgi:hypothetical protein
VTPDESVARQRREAVEHPFGTIKARMGATHFLMKTLPRVAAETALHVLAYNLTRVMSIIGVQPAPGSDDGTVVTDVRLSPVAEPPKTAGIRIRSTSKQKSRQSRQNDQKRHLPKIATRQCFCQSVFTRPRPIRDMQRAATRSPRRRDRGVRAAT